MRQNIRYAAWLRSGSAETYVIWNMENIREWAADSYRGLEMRREHRDGWQFPILTSSKNHRGYDAWLLKKFPLLKGSK